MDPEKLRKIEDNLLRQEKHLRRALSQTRIVLTVLAFPAALWCFAAVLFVIMFVGAPDPLGFLVTMSPYILPKLSLSNAVTVIVFLLFFALWLECRLKLRHIETIKKLREIEGSQPAEFTEPVEAESGASPLARRSAENATSSSADGREI